MVSRVVPAVYDSKTKDLETVKILLLRVAKLVVFSLLVRLRESVNRYPMGDVNCNSDKRKNKKYRKITKNCKKSNWKA